MRFEHWRTEIAVETAPLQPANFIRRIAVIEQKSA